LPEPHDRSIVKDGRDTNEDREGREGRVCKGLVLCPVAAAVTRAGVVALPCRPTSAHHTARASQLLLLLLGVLASSDVAAVAAVPPSLANGDGLLL
jgi:hypothetical protein